MPDPQPTILIVGASRGLGLALAGEFIARGWTVIGTVRGDGRTGLHDLAERNPDRIAIERVDINDQAQIARLRGRLADRRLDTLFVNAGTTTHDEHVRAGDVTTDEFTRLMLTNALAPMRVIETLQDLVPRDGLIGAMSSGQGSIANNETGMREIYRASKAALNMLMRSLAARETEPRRAMIVLAPGWIKTDLGGPDARFTIEESASPLVDVLMAARNNAGLHYLDRFGNTVPW